MQVDEGQQQEQRGSVSERQRGGGSGQFHLPGAQVMRDGGGTQDIKNRTALANASFTRLNKIWSARGIGRKTKATLFKTLVVSVLLYSCETWKLRRRSLTHSRPNASEECYASDGSSM